MKMALPTLTNEQRKAASEKGVAARQARAELCGKVKRGEVTLVDVLNSDDPAARKMRTYDLLKSLPGYGVAKAQRLMDELGIARSRRVQGLGQRQRDALLSWYIYNEMWEKVNKKEVTVKEVFDNPDPLIQRMPVVDLIAACHGFGKIRANKVMYALNIWPASQLKELDEATKATLVNVLDNGAPYA